MPVAVAHDAEMNPLRRIATSRPITISAISIAAISFLLAATAAKADDWQACISNQPDAVLSACSAVIDQAGRADADIARAYATRGEWFRVRRRNEEAQADFEQAEKLDQNSYVAIAGLAATLAQKGHAPEALAEIERAIALNPQNAYGYFVRGGLRQQQSQLTDAMADYDHAITLRGDVAIY